MPSSPKSAVAFASRSVINDGNRNNKQGSATGETEEGLAEEKEENVNSYLCDTTTNLEFKRLQEQTPDQVLDIIGPRNVYVLVIWVAMATCWGLAAMPMMASTFFMNSPCSNDNTNSTKEKCSPEEMECQELNGTLTKEFNLPVGDSNMLGLTQLSTSMYLVGVVIGAIVLPRLSDRFGRHPVLCASLIFSGIFGCFSSLVPVMQLFIAMRFLQGVFFPGIGITNWVLAYESIPLSLRSYTAMLFGLWWVIGYCAIGPLAWALPNWRWLAFSASAPSVLFGVFYLLTLPESFHWLASAGDEQRVRKWMKQANLLARMFDTEQLQHLRVHNFCTANRRRSHPKEEIQVAPTSNFSPESGSAMVASAKYSSTSECVVNLKNQASTSEGLGTAANSDLGGSGMTIETTTTECGNGRQMGEEEGLKCRPRANSTTPFTLQESTNTELEVAYKKHVNFLGIYTAIFAYLWTSNAFVYYGLSLFSTKLYGDVYINYVLVGLVEIPSYLVSPFLLDKFGRRVFIALAHAIAAFSYFVIVFNQLMPRLFSLTNQCPHETVTLAMWLLGKFAISCSFTSLFVYASEVFPTVSRTSNIGVCAATSRIGSCLVPLVQKISREAQLGAFGVAALLAALLTLMLPETRNQSLPASSIEVPSKKGTNKTGANKTM